MSVGARTRSMHQSLGLLLFAAGVVLAGPPAARAHPAVKADGPGYFFDHKPFIQPKIIEDLSTWVSDTGEQVVAINLPGSMGTNRYFADIKTDGNARPFVYYEDTDACQDAQCPGGPPSFGYRLIGRTPSGIYVLFTESSGGGSGRFRNLLLVSLTKDKGLSFNKKTDVLRLDRARWLIRRLAEITLGDRYEGDIRVQGNEIHVGRDRYSHSAGFFPKDTTLKLELTR